MFWTAALAGASYVETGPITVVYEKCFYFRRNYYAITVDDMVYETNVQNLHRIFWNVYQRSFGSSVFKIQCTQ